MNKNEKKIYNMIVNENNYFLGGLDHVETTKKYITFYDRGTLCPGTHYNGATHHGCNIQYNRYTGEFITGYWLL